MSLFVNVAYYLNPQFQYSYQLGSRTDLSTTVKDVIKKLKPNVNVQAQVLNEIKYFQNELLSFGESHTIRSRDTMTPSNVFNIISFIS